MIFLPDEIRLLVLYYCGSAQETAAVMREALPDITDIDTLRAAGRTIEKLETIPPEAFAAFIAQSGAFL